MLLLSVVVVVVVVVGVVGVVVVVVVVVVFAVITVSSSIAVLTQNGQFFTSATIAFSERSPGREGDNIKMDFKEEGWRHMDCIDLAQNRKRGRALVNAVMNIRVPHNEVNFLTS
jgi:hypothetical protein